MACFYMIIQKLADGVFPCGQLPSAHGWSEQVPDLPGRSTETQSEHSPKDDGLSGCTSGEGGRPAGPNGSERSPDSHEH